MKKIEIVMKLSVDDIFYHVQVNGWSKFATKDLGKAKLYFEKLKTFEGETEKVIESIEIPDEEDTES
jgi:hypothetical protein